MIIIKVSGGLGNQMFQYAFAKALEQRRNILVKLDTSNFKISSKGITPRTFLLDKFNTTLPIATQEDFHKIKIPYPTKRGIKENIFRIFFRIEEFFRSSKSKKIIINHNLDFNRELFTVNDNSYVSGVWTNSNYFTEIKDIILKEITPHFTLSKVAEKILSDIKNTNSVSIHIRRGDYLKYTHKFILLTDDYYEEAIELLKKKENDLTFFVFSDDINYVKENYGRLFGEKIIYVSDQGIKDCEELWLMSRCRHNIIANSTFSWWGAWLNQNTNKIVIAPKQYRADDKDMPGFYPQNWIEIQ